MERLLFRFSFSIAVMGLVAKTLLWRILFAMGGKVWLLFGHKVVARKEGVS